MHAKFPVAYEKDSAAFIESEIARVESTLKKYENVVFTAFPLS